MTDYERGGKYYDLYVHAIIDAEVWHLQWSAEHQENAKLRKLVRDYHTFLALTELAQPIGSVIAAHGHPTLSVKALDKRYRELGIDVES